MVIRNVITLLLYCTSWNYDIFPPNFLFNPKVKFQFAQNETVGMQTLIMQTFTTDIKRIHYMIVTSHSPRCVFKCVSLDTHHLCYVL